MIFIQVHFFVFCSLTLFYTVPETESQPSREYVECLQQLKDVLSELEGKQHTIVSGLSEPSKVENALQQTKVTLTFALK